MIPKKIHFCWYGQGHYNDIMHRCFRSWEEKLPDYEIIKWDESNTPMFPFLRVLYTQKKWSFISDYVRLYALYTEGGIYLDTDIEVVKSFDDLLEYPAFIGFQSELENHKHPINAAVVGAEKGNPFILDCLRETEKKQRLGFNAMGGPPVASKVLRSYGLEDYRVQELNGVKIFTTEYFYPLHWKLPFDRAYEFVTGNTYTIHWWQESWTLKKRNLHYYADSLRRKIQKLPLLAGSWIEYLISRNGFYFFKRKGNPSKSAKSRM